jgi:hypothetical protein
MQLISHGAGPKHRPSLLSAKRHKLPFHAIATRGPLRPPQPAAAPSHLIAAARPASLLTMEVATTYAAVRRGMREIRERYSRCLRGQHAGERGF